MVAARVEDVNFLHSILILNNRLTQVFLQIILVVVIIDILIVRVDLVGSLDHPFHKCFHSVLVVL